MRAERLNREKTESIDLLGSVSSWDNPDAVVTDFLDTLRDGVVVVGSDRRIKYFNESHAKQLDIAPGCMNVGDDLRDALMYLASIDRLGPMNGLTPEQAVDQRIARWGDEENRVERRRLSTGRILDIYRTQTDRDETIAVHVDVTDQVRIAEQVERQQLYMQVLLENTSDGICMLDANGNFVVYNAMFLELYAIDPANVRWGMSYDEVVGNSRDLKDMSEAKRKREHELRRAFAFDRSATSTRRRLGDGRTLSISKTNLEDGGCVMTMRDMTEQLRREDELLEARNLAEETSRHKSEFVARMSHEMRTPLNGILGVAALLERTPLSDKQSTLIDVVSSSGKVLLRLIDDILDLSRMDAETFEVVEDQLDIETVIEDCLSIIRPTAEDHGLKLRFIGDAASVPPLKGDAIRIKQIMLNLLTNAVKFTEEGHVEVLLTHSAGPEGITMTISVTDTGVGIAADQLDQIFNRFYQIDGTVTRRHGGAGLGLAITRKLVDVMGGAIQVSSTLGVGTEFRVVLTLPPAGRTRTTDKQTNN